MNNILNSFKTKDSLSDKIWNNADSNNISDIKMDSQVKTHLLEIAQLFIESANVEPIDVHDITAVGSICNYNWSNYSDIDLHVIIDKSKLGDNQELVDEFLKTKKETFSNVHDLKIHGFDVELYFQDITELLDSKGVYSVLYNKWVSQPTKDKKEFDRVAILKKVKYFYNMFNKTKDLADVDAKIKAIDVLKDKIKKYRKAGLENNGEMGVENMVFKYLRRIGFIEEVNDTKFELIDKKLSLENNKRIGF
jgi:hypothetical protein